MILTTCSCGAKFAFSVAFVTFVSTKTEPQIADDEISFHFNYGAFMPEPRTTHIMYLYKF